VKVSHALIQELKRLQGAPVIAGVSGANIESLFESALVEALDPILTRHEFGAASLLDAYGRRSGKPGILLCTSGAGALNAIPGLAESATSRVPLIAILGEPALSATGRGAFQETSGLAGTFDLLATLRPLCKSVERITSPAQALPALRAALAQAVESAPGPCVLLLPRDIQEAEIHPNEDVVTSAGASSPPISTSRDITSEWAIAKENTLFILGERLAREPQASRLMAWLQKNNYPFVLTLEARALAPLDHPLCRGVTGVMGDRRARKAVAAADTVFAIGTRLVETDRYGIEAILLEKSVILLNDESPVIHGPNWEFRPVDLKGMLESLPNTQPDWACDIAPRSALSGPFEREIQLSDLVPLLAPYAQARARNWVFDAGNATAALYGSLPLPHGSTLTLALGMGGMGYSFGAAIGAAIGAKIARPQPTAVVAGDGAFFMHGSEISTAVERNLPIQYFIIDNHGHGMCETREKIFFDRNPSPLNRITRSKLAQGLQALYPSVPVRHAANCAQALELLSDTQPESGPAITVLEVSNEEIPAFLPFHDLLEKRKKP